MPAPMSVPTPGTAEPAAAPATPPVADTEPGKKGKKTAKASAEETAVPDAQANAPSDTQDEPTIPCPRRDGTPTGRGRCGMV